MATLRDLKQMLSSLDNMVLCCGNNEAKYDVLIGKEKRDLYGPIGYVCALLIYFVAQTQYVPMLVIFILAINFVFMVKSILCLYAL